MGKSHHYLGASGSGMVMKLMGNLLVAAQAVALAESVAMAKQAGLEKEAVLGVFKSALFASGMVELSAPFMFDDSHEPFFHLKNLCKDARLIQGAAAELGVPLPAMSSNAEILALATGRGSGNRTRRRCTLG